MVEILNSIALSNIINDYRCFHVNFGFNTYLFDWLHGTLKRNDRVYGEDIFGGKGKKMD